MRNKIGKTLFSTLSVAVLSLSSAPVIAADYEGTLLPIAQPIKADADQEQVKPVSNFRSVTGTIQEMSDYGANEEMRLVTVESENGDVNRFVVSDQTYVMDELAVGAEIIAFYDANVPVIMIYPPQYHAVAIALADNGRTVKVDHFDENLVSADGSLKLNIADETDIIRIDGTAYEGDLTNQALIVSYGPSTRSIPAQTTPEHIVVLPEGEPPAPDGEEDVADEDQETYAEITGTIQDMTGLVQEDAASERLVSVETSDGEPVHLIVSASTYVDEELAAGVEIVAFYNAKAPMTMIYPPRYHAEAVAVVKEGRSVTVGRFDESLLNSEQSLRLNITDTTEIVSRDGTAFEGDVASRKLFVEYEVVALSFPAQTAPTRIVVLDEEADAGILDHSDESSVVVIRDLTGIEHKQWMINDQWIAAPSAYINEQGTVMVPLRAIAEALGYELTWEADTMTVRVGNAVSLQIGNEDYRFARMAPIQLGDAPELVDSLTYVPISFFKDVIRARDVIVDAEQIVIRE